MEKLIACTFCRTICFLDNMKLIGEAKTDIFFSIWVFFHEYSRFPGKQGKKEGISLTPLYLQPLHTRSDIRRAITADSSPLHIASSRKQTRKLQLFKKPFWQMCILVKKYFSQKMYDSIQESLNFRVNKQLSKVKG